MTRRDAVTMTTLSDVTVMQTLHGKVKAVNVVEILIALHTILSSRSGREIYVHINRVLTKLYR